MRTGGWRPKPLPVGTRSSFGWKAFIPCAILAFLNSEAPPVSGQSDVWMALRLMLSSVFVYPYYA